MGQINVPGLGKVNIEADGPNAVPNDIETKAILNAIGQIPEPELPSPATPEDRELFVPEAVEQPATPAAALPSRTGLVSPESRGRVRQAVEEQNGFLQFLTEMPPATVGTLAGITLMAPVPIPGARVFGGMAGGVIGEFLGQEVGIAPRSDVNLALSGAGPLVGKGLGATKRGIQRLAGGRVAGFPPAAQAAARVTAKRSFDEFETIGGKLLAKQEGLTARTADDLFKAVRRAGVNIAGARLVNTQKAIKELAEEMRPLVEFPEVAQSMKVLQQLEKSLKGQVSFETFIGARALVGAAIQRFKNAGGTKLGKAKQAFAAMSKDLEEISQKLQIVADPKGKFVSRTKPARAAKLAKAAIKRAKLEFAVADVEGLVAQHAKVEGTDIVLNAKGMLTAFNALTNPKSRKFDKNLVDALGDNIALMKARLGVLAEIADKAKSGAGGLVIAQAGARVGRSVAGATIGAVTGGLATGGVLGAGIGGIAGAKIPGKLTALLASERGFKFLEAAARFGRGEISERAWAVAGLILTRLAEGEPAEPTIKAETVVSKRLQESFKKAVSP